MAPASEPRPKVLIVDDDDTVLRVLAASLEADYDVSTADSGQHALEILGKEEQSVLLSDQRMPEMTGVELAARARELQPHIVPIIISAYTDPPDIIAAINQGQVFRFIRKPWDLSDLLHTLQQAATRHQLSRDNARLVAELTRRLQALEILQQVFAAAAVAAGAHPADVLLERLHEVVPYDLAGLLLLSDEGTSGTLRLVSRSNVSDANVAQLRDQALALFTVCGGTLPEERQLRLNAGVRVDPTLIARPIESQAQVPLLREGRPVGVLVVQAFLAEAYPPDVTRLLDLLANGTTDAVVRARKGVSRQSQLLEQALSGSPDAILLVDGTGEVNVANPAARQILDSMSGSLWEALGIWPDDILAAPDLKVRREVKVGERSMVAELGRAPNIPDGEPRVVVALRDVTAIEAENARRREFLSTSSHEIRTPLTSVIATLELILHGAAGGISDKQREYLEIADKACESLNQMITNLLDLEKFERGSVELQCRAMDPGQLLRALSARYRAAATAKELQLEVVTPTTAVRLVADPYRVEQVIGNLLGNAVKFAREHTSVRLTLQASERVPGWAVLGVHNQGDAVPPNEWPTVFDRFRQAKHERERGRGRGSGLGLAISRSIARAHGGVLLLESGALGTSFWLALPIEPAAPIESTAPGYEPVWVLDSSPDVDRVAAAAVLTAAGLGVFLLPADVAEAQTALDVLGTGITVAAPGAAIDRPFIEMHRGDRSTLFALGQAMVALSRFRDRQLTITPHPGGELWAVLRQLGIREAVEGTSDLDLVLNEVPGGIAAKLIVLSSQLSPEARRRAPVRRLFRRIHLAGSDVVFGIVRFQHLSAFKAVYGSQSEVALKRALSTELQRVLVDTNPTTECLAVEGGAILAGRREGLERALQEIGRRLPLLARLHYRKQDRDAGCLRLGSDTVPIVGVTTQILDGTASEARLVAAVGL